MKNKKWLCYIFILHSLKKWVTFVSWAKTLSHCSWAFLIVEPYMLVSRRKTLKQVFCLRGMNLKFKTDRLRVHIRSHCPYSVPTRNWVRRVCQSVCFSFSEENHFILTVAQSCEIAADEPWAMYRIYRILSSQTNALSWALMWWL